MLAICKTLWDATTGSTSLEVSGAINLQGELTITAYGFADSVKITAHAMQGFHTHPVIGQGRWWSERSTPPSPEDYFVCYQAGMMLGEAHALVLTKEGVWQISFRHNANADAAAIYLYYHALAHHYHFNMLSCAGERRRQRWHPRIYSRLASRCDTKHLICIGTERHWARLLRVGREHIAEMFVEDQGFYEQLEWPADRAGAAALLARIDGQRFFDVSFFPYLAFCSSGLASRKIEHQSNSFAASAASIAFSNCGAKAESANAPVHVAPLSM
jgi:hypothetical protein